MSVKLGVHPFELCVFENDEGGPSCSDRLEDNDGGAENFFGQSRDQ